MPDRGKGEREGGESHGSAELNARMIERMKASGAIRSAAVEAAFRRTPRHLFVPGVGLDLVYSGNALVTRSDPERGITSSSSEVGIMAPMLEDLALEEGQSVLEIGAGTGYNAALLDELVGPSGEVTSVDNQPDVVADARDHLATAGHPRVRVVAGDGYAGYPEGAPYDRIIATASVLDIPLPWRDQLREGGLLTVPIRFGATAQMVVTFARRQDRLDSTAVVAGGFMPLRTDLQLFAEPLKIENTWLVQLATPQEGDPELLAGLLHSEPAIETFESYPGQAIFSLAGIVEPDWIVLRLWQRNGMWQGVLDRSSRGLAFVAPIQLPTGTLRSSLITYGSQNACTRLKKVLARLDDMVVDRATIQAVPRPGSRPTADLTFEGANFYYGVNWSVAAPRAQQN